MGYEGPWRQEMLRMISPLQSDDGSFSNPLGAPNKEDDPLLATALAIRGLF